eukprot:NODE_1940_length_863_cov_7.856265_g1358_i0.p2 GENE.NODE_1940_length_863_cov_7.856265_g1358_i0~~NODE_1940_length_863_cov_7.856265_g1358_i0.p2  ORF type:complete len:63 (-),score=6.31 NODE_1940_length_863_cov_7.856265_g1358_i0:141-329(-)
MIKICRKKGQSSKKKNAKVGTQKSPYGTYYVIFGPEKRKKEHQKLLQTPHQKKRISDFGEPF